MSVSVNPSRATPGSALSNLFSIFNTAKGLGDSFKPKASGGNTTGLDPKWQSGPGALNPGKPEDTAAPTSNTAPPVPDTVMDPQQSSDAIMRRMYAMNDGAKAAAMDSELGTAGADAAAAAGADAAATAASTTAAVGGGSAAYAALA